MSFGTGGVVYHSFIFLKIIRDFPFWKIPVAVLGAIPANTFPKEEMVQVRYLRERYGILLNQNDFQDNFLPVLLKGKFLNIPNNISNNLPAAVWQEETFGGWTLCL